MAPGELGALQIFQKIAIVCAMRTPLDESKPVHDRNYVTALERGLSVIRTFANQTDNLTLSDVAQSAGLPRATTRRLLLTLKRLGYIESDRNFFRITPQILVLANAYLTSSNLLRVSQPYIERISRTLDESVSVSILNQDAVVYVARSAKRRIESLHRDVGSQLPAYCTSMGRILLAYLGEQDLDGYLERTKLIKLTSRTIVDPRELRRVLEESRRNEYCLIDQEHELNLRSIAVPLRNAADRVIAAVNVGTEAVRTSKKQMLRSFLAVLRQAAAEMRPLLV
jgi:IclR family transcriptional regulator, pca regulon regulatory protein